MNRRVRYAAAAAICVALAASACGRRVVDSAALEASSPTFARPIDFAAPDYDALAAAIEHLANEERRRADVAPLDSHRLLRKVSRRYAQRMVDKGFLAHEDPTDAELRTPTQRVAAQGAQNASISENIADVPGFPVASGEPFYVRDRANFVITRTPDGPPIEPHTYASFAATVVEGWMNSPGHRRNLLSPDAREQGIGAQMYLQNGIPAFVVVQKFQLFEPLR